jgi:hypothetical protein
MIKSDDQLDDRQERTGKFSAACLDIAQDVSISVGIGVA